MAQFTLAALAAVMLVQPVLAAGDKAADSAKPSSFVPHPRTNHHVYGAPIEPAIVGHGSAHHKSAPKKQSSSAAKRKRP